ncbi:ribonucleotide reductase of class Ia, alpha subunit [Bacteriophage Eos]|nr:ribonucleotide reductase of class Ia, alpha subunit [Bacteriophage Eos]
MAKVLYIDKFRSRRTKIHPHSLAAVNQFNKTCPWDDTQHAKAFSVANEFPNKPLTKQDIISRVGDPLLQKILDRAEQLDW